MRLYGKLEQWGIKEISKTTYDRLVSEGRQVRCFFGVYHMWYVIE